jgi:hypothetical protein
MESGGRQRGAGVGAASGGEASRLFGRGAVSTAAGASFGDRSAGATCADPGSAISGSVFPGSAGDSSAGGIVTPLAMLCDLPLRFFTERRWSLVVLGTIEAVVAGRPEAGTDVDKVVARSTVATAGNELRQLANRVRAGVKEGAAVTGMHVAGVPVRLVV